MTKAINRHNLKGYATLTREGRHNLLNYGSKGLYPDAPFTRDIFTPEEALLILDVTPVNRTFLDMKTVSDGRVDIGPEIAGLLNLSPDGKVRPLINNAGEVTESNSATIEADITASNVLLGTIDTDTGDIAIDTGDILVDTGDILQGRWERRAARPTWVSVPGTETESWRAEPIRMAFSATTDIAGNFSGNIVPALAGYFGCVNIEYVWASGTDPAWDLSFAAAGGFTGPPAMIGLASVANTIGPNWSPGLAYRTTADNVGLTLNIANGGNGITYWFYGTTHYET